MRLFVALELPAVIRDEIRRVLEGIRDRLPAARWVSPERWHLTIRFLGDTEAGRLAGLDEALREAFAAGPPLPLRVRGGGAFPPRGGPRVLWLGVEAPSLLQDLYSRVEDAVQSALGVPAEGRAFSPHVTVARIRSAWPESARGDWRRAVEVFGSSRFTVWEGRLIESRLGSAGVRYRRLGTYPMELRDE